jgi:diguanylate cyclase (GGDEF)-like protein/PAS domain S-box-containing protein
MLDIAGNVTNWNKGAMLLSGHEAEEMIGKHFSSFYLPEDLRDDKSSKVLKQAFINGEYKELGWRVRKDGTRFFASISISVILDEANQLLGYAKVTRPADEAIPQADAQKASQQVLLDELTHRYAYYDELTNLPNRRLLLDRMQMANSSAARSHLFGAILFLDMDNLKIVNDTMGHEFGDQLLVQVATRIRSCVREIDTVARLGGDEFVVLFEELDAKAEQAWHQVGLIAETIRATLAEPYQLKERQYFSSPSIGITIFNGQEGSIEEILRQSDVAMYQAKESGRNTIRFYDTQMQKSVEARALIEAELSRAVPDRQLLLYYQVQVNNEQHPIGAEAFLRWIHPNGGVISPNQFIPIAEESSLILKVGQWVLETACAQLALWSHEAATKDIVLAVNVSMQQFKMNDFVDNVAAIVRAHQVDFSKLRLEFSENVVLNDIPDFVNKLNIINELGISLSLDDFGTGYSSLSYLKQLPIQQLKIDNSFVRCITEKGGDTSMVESIMVESIMVESIIDMARNFGLSVIAEGVENSQQMEFLKRRGCNSYQGYLFGKPVPIAEFHQLLLKLGSP